MPKAPCVFASHAWEGIRIHGQTIQFRKQLNTSSTALIGSAMLLRASFIHVGLNKGAVCPDILVEQFLISVGRPAKMTNVPCFSVVQANAGVEHWKSPFYPPSKPLSTHHSWSYVYCIWKLLCSCNTQHKIIYEQYHIRRKDVFYILHNNEHESSRGRSASKHITNKYKWCPESAIFWVVMRIVQRQADVSEQHMPSNLKVEE